MTFFIVYMIAYLVVFLLKSWQVVLLKSELSWVKDKLELTLAELAAKEKE